MNEHSISRKQKKVQKNDFFKDIGKMKKSNMNKSREKKNKNFKKIRIKGTKQEGRLLYQSTNNNLHSKGEKRHADHTAVEVDFTKKEELSSMSIPIKVTTMINKTNSGFSLCGSKKCKSSNVLKDKKNKLINKKLKKERSTVNKNIQGKKEGEYGHQQILNKARSHENITNILNRSCDMSIPLNYPTYRVFHDNYKNDNIEKKKQKYKKKKKIGEYPEEIVNSSIFRYINEYMYTNNSETVQKKLKETKNIFSIYHSGYRNQKNKWPKNPVNIIINYLKNNFTKTSKIADLGCGEAEIAQALQGWSVISYDLIQFNEHVTVCNITELPLSDNSHDCFVICLSLMNTDWPKIIFESVRCLKRGLNFINKFCSFLNFNYSRRCQQIYKLQGFHEIHEECRICPFEPSNQCLPVAVCAETAIRIC